MSDGTALAIALGATAYGLWKAVRVIETGTFAVPLFPHNENGGYAFHRSRAVPSLYGVMLGTSVL